MSSYTIYRSNFQSHTYSYDKVGNRTGKNGITYTINTVNEVTGLSDGTSFVYDNNGNRTQKTKGADTWDYIYDYANRLKKVEENDFIIGEYVYDGDGTRIQVTEDSVTTTYIYSGLDILYEDTMTGTAVYIYGPTGNLAKRTTINQETNTFYYHTDHLGSTRVITDSSKNIVSTATCHPFGEPDAQEGSEPYLFTGKERDSTGLYYYGARYYDAELGRFITRDPLRGGTMNPQSLNRYTYCLNNPVKFTDPWGEAPSAGTTECQIEGGGTVEEPEITGDPTYNSGGSIDIPTNYGDVTIDPNKGENIEDWEEKARDKGREKEQNNLRKKLAELEKKYDAKNKKNLLKSLYGAEEGLNLMGFGGIPCLESDDYTAGKGAKYMTGGGILASLGAGLYFGSPYIAPILIGVGKTLSIPILIGIGSALPIIGIGLLVVGTALLLYGAYKMNKEHG